MRKSLILQVKTLAPAMPAMIFSCAEDKALCMAIVPKDLVGGKGFKASDWCKEVQALIDGKVGLIELQISPVTLTQ